MAQPRQKRKPGCSRYPQAKGAHLASADLTRGRMRRMVGIKTTQEIRPLCAAGSEVYVRCLALLQVSGSAKTHLMM